MRTTQHEFCYDIDNTSKPLPGSVRGWGVGFCFAVKANRRKEKNRVVNNNQAERENHCIPNIWRFLIFIKRSPYPSSILIARLANILLVQSLSLFTSFAKSCCTTSSTFSFGIRSSFAASKRIEKFLGSNVVYSVSSSIDNFSMFLGKLLNGKQVHFHHKYMARSKLT